MALLISMKPSLGEDTKFDLSFEVFFVLWHVSVYHNAYMSCMDVILPLASCDPFGELGALDHTMSCPSDLENEHYLSFVFYWQLFLI